MVLGRSDASLLCGRPPLRWGERTSLVEQLACRSPGATRASAVGRRLERFGHRLVRPVGSESEMSHALLRLGDQLRQPAVERASTTPRSGCVDRRCIERVRKRDPAFLGSKQPYVLGRSESGRRRGGLHELGGWMRERGRSEQRSAALRRQVGDAAGDQLTQTLRNR